MKKIRIAFLTLCAFAISMNIVFVQPAAAQNKKKKPKLEKAEAGKNAATISAKPVQAFVSKLSPTEFVSETPIPLDQNVTHGVLENGMHYYIRQNEKPENYAELRLAVNAGSILETDAQQGLAHFAEHMAFNGTRNFPKHELIDYLESIGTKFGAHLNAYTSFDETVYMLRVPTDDPEKFETGVQIIEDWAHNVLFEDEEIDKERGVVIEEWRTRLGAYERMRQKYWPKIWHESHYADRLPIGKVDILENFEYETLRDFYSDWYRPDLMAVIAVGDFEVDQVEQMIKEKFSRIPAVENPKKRTEFEVPDHAQTFIAVESDEESSRNSISLEYKHDRKHYKNMNDYRSLVLHNLYNTMMGGRLSELAQQADPPFIYAYTFYGNMVKSKDAYSSYAGVSENGFERGLETLLRENERVRIHGFTDTEFERAKKEIMSGLEQQFKEKDKTESRRLIGQYVYHYLYGSPATGIENKLKTYGKILPEINLEDVNSLAKEWVRDENRVVVLTGIKKEGANMPTEAQVQAILDKISTETPDPYVDEVLDAPLVEEVPEGSEILSEGMVEDLGLIELTLANGVKVVLKQTDFKNDEILMSAFRPGGHSNYGEAEFMSASMSSEIVDNAGLGAFSMVQLEKYLADKVVSVYPYVSAMEEGFRGSCSSKDLEIMLQMIYQYANNPRVDEDAFHSYMTKEKGWYKNVLSNPDSYFYHKVQKIMSGDHYSKGYPSNEQLETVDMKSAYQIFNERLGTANGFTYVFVGNFELEKMKSMLSTYIGGIPQGDKVEGWKDLNINGPEGVVEEIIRKGKEPKSIVNIQFTGPHEWSTEENYKLSSMISVLRIMLRESMREDKGGVYGVGVSPSMKRIPKEAYKISLNWMCSPDNAEDLIATAMKDIKDLCEQGPSDKNLNKVKETQRKEVEVGLKENRWWLSQLKFRYDNELPSTYILNKMEKIERLDAETVRMAAVKYFNMDNYVKMVLYPEK